MTLRRRWLGACAAVAALGLAALISVNPLPWRMLLQGGWQISNHRHFDNAPIARAAMPSPLPAAPTPLRWPDGLETAAAETDIAGRGTVALLVARRGQLIYERYFNDHSADSLVASFSMAKSVVAVLLGMAIDDGRIGSVDVPISSLLPELRDNDPRFDRITLRHLLAMRSGIAFDENYRSPFSDVWRFYVTSDLRRQVAHLRIDSEPNQLYRYSSGDTQLLAMAIERAVGLPLARYAQLRLWQPMGAQYDASWSLDDAVSGQARGFCCLNARAVDYLRLGLMMMNQGRWNGHQMVSAEWVRQSTAAQSGLPGPAEPAWRNIERLSTPEAAFYAWQWRRLPLPGPRPLQPGPMVYAQGLLGQILLIDPESQTVVLRLGQRQGGRHWPAWMTELVRLNR